MRVPISWLREFVALPADDAAIADRLAMLGFPVDAVERRPAITGVVIGRIAALERHPNADRLQVAQIDVGGEQPLTIATAATNVAAGQTIAVATIGAQLPEMVIAPRTMRGIASQGMMISAEELALPAEWFEDGIMQMDESLALGSDVVEVFGLDTAVLDVEITANRPDAMSVLGLARELAASYDTPLRAPSFENPGRGAEPPGTEPHVTIESEDCRRFVAQRFDGVRVGTAPAWMRVRLALAGQRPINNLVDVSNYVMLETGQPLHFYDAAAIADSHLIVRNAREGEPLVTLDGVERTLDSQALVIAGAGSRARSGRRDGRRRQRGDGADDGHRPGVRQLSRPARAPHRERAGPANRSIGAPREIARPGPGRCRSRARRAVCCAISVRRRMSPALPATHSPHPLRSLSRPATSNAYSAWQSRATASSIISTALGCGVAAQGEAFAVTPPLWRRDLVIAADLIEEVARIEGYDAIPAVVPSVAPHEISSAGIRAREPHRAGALRARVSRDTHAFVAGSVVRPASTARRH